MKRSTFDVHLHLLFLIMGAFLISSCQNQSRPLDNMTNIKSPTLNGLPVVLSPTLTSTPISIFIPTSIILTHTPTFIQTPASTETPIAAQTSTPLISNYHQECLKILSEVSPNFLSGYGIVIMGKDYQIVMISPQNNQPIFYPYVTKLGIPGLSPDGKWLAVDLFTNSGDYLEIRSLDGTKHWEIPYKTQYEGSLYWIDNSRIQIHKPYGAIILNPFQNLTKEYDFSKPPISLDIGQTPAFDSALTRMIYLRPNPNDIPEIVLWDLNNNKEIWNKQVSPFWKYYSWGWSNDGSQFAVGIEPIIPKNEAFELMIVTRDGKESQVTHFIDSNGYGIGTVLEPTWSPDKRYVAFWLDNSLAIYAAETGLVTNYCIKASTDIPMKPLWSPDSKQIAVEGLGDPQNGPIRPIVVDIQKNMAIEFGNSNIMLGWVANPP